MSEENSGLAKRAAIAVRLAALWLLTGALFKLFAGSPKMIPELVLSTSPFSWTLTYQIAIAIELSIVCVALLKPHRGWIPIAAIFGFFLILLTDMLVKGKASCGCMGDSITIHPAIMLTCDAALLAFVLLTKPWKNLAPPGLSTPLMLVGIAISLALPWIVVRPGQATLQPGTNGTTTVDPVKGTPSGGRVYINMSPEKWLEKSIYDVEEFTRVVPIEKIPSDGRIILWRQHCDHCAKHLREMAAETATTPILLVQVMDDLNASRAVDLMPTGDHVTSVQLPPGEGMFTTPVEIRVEGGVVKSALLADDLEKAHQ